MRKEEVADLIDSFLDGSCGEWDWDDFMYAKLDDPELKDVQARCAGLPEAYPPGHPGEYCGAEGLEVMRGIAARLRGSCE